MASNRTLTFTGCTDDQPPPPGIDGLEHYWEKLRVAVNEKKGCKMEVDAFQQWFNDFEEDYFAKAGMPVKVMTNMMVLYQKRFLTAMRYLMK